MYLVFALQIMCNCLSFGSYEILSHSIAIRIFKVKLTFDSEYSVFTILDFSMLTTNSNCFIHESFAIYSFLRFNPKWIPFSIFLHHSCTDFMYIFFFHFPQFWSRKSISFMANVLSDYDIWSPILDTIDQTAQRYEIILQKYDIKCVLQ